MRTYIKQVAIAVVAVMSLVSCSNEQSLQEYYVDNQDSSDFILIDVPMSLLRNDNMPLSEEDKKVLKTVRKINMIAYPVKADNKAKYPAELAKVNAILKGEKYEQLMSASHETGKMKLYFLGEEDAIDEVIAFASDENKGFAIARVLGDDMNIGDMMKVAQSFEKSGVNLGQFEGVMDVFKEN